MGTKEILVVDDEMGIRELLSEILFDEGYRVQLAENAEEARRCRDRHPPDLVLLDIWMPDTDGVTLLKEWLAEGKLTMPVVMMSGHGTIETAVEATRIGAVDFLEKPIALQKLLKTVAQAIQRPVTIPVAAPALPQPAEWLRVTEVPGAVLSLELPLREAHEQFDRLYFEYHLRQEGGNITRVAEKIGLERTHLHRKLKQLDVKVEK